MLLDVSGLQTRFDTSHGPRYAVNGISLRVKRGSIMGLVGESGCGKSTAVRSMIGLMRPPGRVTGGEALLGGVDLLTLPKKELRRRLGQDIGFITQNPFGVLNPVLKIGTQFVNFMRAHDVRGKPSALLTRAEEALAGVSLPDPRRVLDGYAHELSGGMAQRVCIAMMTLLDPQIIIADEPTTALDVTVQKGILELLRRRVSDHAGAVIVTHDLSVVAQFCDEVSVMYAGTIVETGAVQEVLTTPSHPYTVALLKSIPVRGRELYELKGRVPSLNQPLTACPFVDRCKFAMDRCRTEIPELTSELAGGKQRLRACFADAGEVISDVH
ncbi:MAG: ABC transporter ATP-binding protein [Cryobacterium sp.]|nr:ABC transporter ATP-binding protein [Cryobacterium sp.]